MDRRVRNKEQFVQKAALKHNYKYDYKLVEYKNSKEKVQIICPTHGEFWQTPSNHLYGFGCMGCCVSDRADRRRLSLEEFLKRAKEQHGDRYDYSEVEYNNRDSKITVVCPEHGPFKVRLAGHLGGVGCTLCDYLAGKNNGSTQITTEQFVEKARSVHGDLYSYENTVYNKSTNKVVVTCSIHGDFEQFPNNHLRGMKCLKCVRELEYYKTVDETTLYLLHIRDEVSEWEFLKLGLSIDVPKRVHHLSLQLPNIKTEILREVKCPAKPAVEFETRVHHDKSLHHFWGAGKFGGYTECYWSKELEKINSLIDEFVETTEGVKEL